MEKIKKIVSSVWFVPALSILLLSLIIFFAGPYIAFAGYYPLATLSSRVIVIISILLIYCLVQLVKYHLKAKNQQKNSKNKENVRKKKVGKKKKKKFETIFRKWD